MLRQALSELRFHPSRFVATLIAIAISVGFMTAISVFIATEQAGTGKANAMALSQADLVLVSPESQVPADLADDIGGLDGVASAAPVASASAEVTAEDRTVFATLWANLAPELRWAELEEGAYPASAGEVTIARDMADKLEVGLGSEVHVSAEQSFTVVGITRDARSLFTSTGYLSLPAEDLPYASAVAVTLADGADPDGVAAAMSDAVADRAPGVEVQTAQEFRDAALVATTGSFDVFKNMLLAFAVIAVLVGMITIANTFTILVAQRRRQLGLLRAVGATGGQVMGRMIVESLLLGALGSAVGVGLGFAVAAVGAQITGSMFWGLTVNWGEVGLAVLVGVLATMVSAVVPSIAASRVKPLEALQAVPTATQAKRAGLARAVIFGVLIAGGAALAVVSQTGRSEWNLAYAAGAGVLLTIGVLGAAPLYVPGILALAGRLAGGAGPTARLALKNSARNPRRAAATATALMLAIGLIVTLQVALTSARTSAMETIDREFPLDLSASYEAGVPAGTEDAVRAVPGVESVAVLRGKVAEVDGTRYFAVDSHAARLAMGVEADEIPDGVARFDEQGPDRPASLTVGGVTLTPETGRLYGWNAFGVNAATLDALPGEVVDAALWVKLTDRTDTTAINQAIAALSADEQPDLSNSGAQMAGILEQVIGVVILVMTALLGVAVLIAIVGVGNTLGLSVLERQRESALLRALGMQRGQLRLMLLIEALALVVVGTLIGFGAGVFFAWLGISAAFAAVPGGAVEMRMTMDPVWTFGLIGVCLVAAAVASVLPGRRAANATPTEALAVD